MGADAGLTIRRVEPGAGRSGSPDRRGRWYRMTHRLTVNAALPIGKVRPQPRRRRADL